jgi:DNA polymerase III delta subunit
MTSPIAYLWGDDDLAIARAVDRLAVAVGESAGGALERLDVRGDKNQAGQQIAHLGERLATQSMFGGGTIAAVWNVGALTVRTEDRDALVRLLDVIAPGNAVAFLEASVSGAREPGQKRLVEAVRKAGGEVRGFGAPKAGALAGWIEGLARERGIRLASGAARELASRVGGYVTDNDADRRSQTRMAALELDKLALYRETTPITAEDVKELVSEAVPGSVWALTDAVGLRDAGKAATLMDRLAPATPELVLLAVLHRRVRELILVADHVASGLPERDLPKTLGLHSFRAEQLAVQARRWTVDELQRALEGLLELDAVVKGAPGHASGDAHRRLGFTLWISDHVARADSG